MALFDPSPFFNKITTGKAVANFRAGETIYLQGSRAESVHYIVSGSVKETVMSGSARREAIIGILEPGDFFGTEGLDGGELTVTGAVALTSSQVIVLSNRAMTQALRDPAFSQAFMSYLLERNGRIEAEKIDLLLNTIEKRLARRLLALAHYQSGAGTSSVIGPEITQEVLANMVGTSRPRVNLFMRKFQTLGLIRYKPNESIEITPRLHRVVLQRDDGE